jgi:predicted heme/steroid binding protein
MPEKIFSEFELRRYSGDDGYPMYIAYNGVVYDVSDAPKWRQGMHENLHFPGQDLSSEIQDAPHHEEVFKRSYIKRVGVLASIQKD